MDEKFNKEVVGWVGERAAVWGGVKAVLWIA
jgi:hypothetical protein